MHGRFLSVFLSGRRGLGGWSGDVDFFGFDSLAARSALVLWRGIMQWSAGMV